MPACFYYGTLMHPKILRRVIGHAGLNIRVCPAILTDYTRHQVKDEDYPGIIPWSQSQELFKRDLSDEERSVRGTLVDGLGQMDILLLDTFEGDEYNRQPVQVHPLGPFVSLAEYSKDDSDLIPSTPPPLPEQLAASIEAETYVFRDASGLEPELWSFATFVKENAWKWHGEPAVERKDIVEVDIVRSRMLGLI